MGVVCVGKVPGVVPPMIARPIGAFVLGAAMPRGEIADRLGQAPLLPYSGYVLDNFATTAEAVATSTTAAGVKPAVRHLMSRNFSAPRSAPKPASVTT